MTVSRLDLLYRRILLSKFFTKGWGNPDHIAQLLKFKEVISTRDLCYKLVDKNHPIEILKEETLSNSHVISGRFRSPLADHLPDVVHPEIVDAYFQMVTPKDWGDQPNRPVCIHLAGTGDHYFWKRHQIMVKPLLKHGIASISLENPFYGYRKPQQQVRSCLLNVSDIFVMGGCLILECIALFHYCERLGLGPMGVTGLSMGGHMASLAATNWPKPLVLVPCLSWTTASAVFTEGVLSDAIDWDYLQTQYNSDKMYYDTLSKLCKIVDDPAEFGLARLPGFDTTVKSIQERYKRSGNVKPRLTPHEIIGLTRGQGADVAASPSTDGTTVNVQLNARDEGTEVGQAAAAGGGGNKKGRLKAAARLKEAILAKVLPTDTVKMMKIRDQNAIWFMRGLMDECTHLRNFSEPVDTRLITAVCANFDAYVPREGCSSLDDIWPGATVVYVKSGHVGGYVGYLNLFRKSILEGFNRAGALYPLVPESGTRG